MPINITSRHDHAEHLGTGRAAKQMFHQTADDARAVLSRAIQLGDAVRQVASRSARAISGTFPSHKMQKAMAAESRVELDALSLADVLEIVGGYNVQAVKVRFPHEGKVCTAIPDIAIHTVTGDLQFWECKPDSGPDAAALDRLRSLRDNLRDCGIGYRVIRPDWIRQEPRASNAKRIWQQADRAVPADVQDAVRELLQAGIDTLGQLQDRADCPMTSLLALIGQGKFAADIHTRVLGADTKVRAPLQRATSGGF